MSFLKLIYEAFCRSLIRFFDNRFQRSDEVEYYRMEIEKLQQENFKLTKFILDFQGKVTGLANEIKTEEEVDWKPLESKYTPWHVRKAKLEQESLERSRALAAEATLALNRKKTTEELEAELLSNDD